MREQRTRRDLGPLVVVVGITAVWLAGRYVLQPGMDWLRAGLPLELRIWWAAIVAAAAVALVAWAVSRDGWAARRAATKVHPANDREDA